MYAYIRVRGWRRCGVLRPWFSSGCSYWPTSSTGVAVCYSVLQYVAIQEWLQCVAACCSPDVASRIGHEWHSMLQRIAVCCSVLQSIVVCCSVLQCITIKICAKQCNECGNVRESLDALFAPTRSKVMFDLAKQKPGWGVGLLEFNNSR